MGGSLKKRVDISLRRERKPSCTLCKNHGMRSNLKGHKPQCPFLNCDCEPCVKGRQKRVVMSKQVRLRRKQMRDIRSCSNCVTPVEPGRVNFSLAAVKTELSLPLTNEHRSPEDEKELAVKKRGERNGALIQSVSNILHSQFSGVPRQQSFNFSAYMPTFQLQWNSKDAFLGFHSYNNWRPEQPVSSCQIEPPNSPGFTVSDNSACVKYCGYSPRTESNSCRFGYSSSAGAEAALLASFESPEQGIPKR